MSISFQEIKVGKAYSRTHLAEIWGYNGTKPLEKGVVTPARDNKIVLFVTQEKLEVAHQYEDELSGGILLWEGTKGHVGDDRISKQLESNDEIHLFFRASPNTPFTYKGLLTLFCCQLFVDVPSRFAFRLNTD